jgi:hypothetical protein
MGRIRKAGSFDFPHRVRLNDGRSVCYDKIEFKFKQWFLHTKFNIPVGGRCSIDYGRNIANYSEYHILQESRRAKRSRSARQEVLKKNRENGMRLAETGIDPLPCQSECCDAAAAANYQRSQLYFDGRVNDIDYDKLKVCYR